VKSRCSPLGDNLLDAWVTNNRVMIYLVEQLSTKLWEAVVPNVPRRTVRMIVAHVHNSRCAWIRTLGKPHGIVVPGKVNRVRESRVEACRALEKSGRAMGRLLELGLERDGRIPLTAAYVWRNLPLDVGHVLTYFVAHEGHHRGQIVMVARQLGMRLPADVRNGLWQWNRRAVEGSRGRRTGRKA
jgi:uncharacterized damage-inducible protein DinB